MLRQWAETWAPRRKRKSETVNANSQADEACSQEAQDDKAIQHIRNDTIEATQKAQQGSRSTMQCTTSRAATQDSNLKRTAK